MDTDAADLIRCAHEAAAHAYAPYSQYVVGAALRGTNGAIYGGCNIENASFPVGLCAERVALAKAISEGQRQFDALAVVTRDGGSPCGMCRQMLYEFAPNLRVIIAADDGRVTYDGPLTGLLPLGFSPANVNS